MGKEVPFQPSKNSNFATKKHSFMQPHDKRQRIELLAPAKNAEIGKQAILHGADAVYIGGPSFGARSAAGNSVDDIRQLCEFAHIYGARIYVTLNTILWDSELKEAEQLVWQLYDAGVDALIVQDLSLLEMPSPPHCPACLDPNGQLHAREGTMARSRWFPPDRVGPRNLH